MREVPADLALKRHMFDADSFAVEAYKHASVFAEERSPRLAAVLIEVFTLASSRSMAARARSVAVGRRARSQRSAQAGQAQRAQAHTSDLPVNRALLRA